MMAKAPVAKKKAAKKTPTKKVAVRKAATKVVVQLKLHQRLHRQPWLKPSEERV